MVCDSLKNAKNANLGIAMMDWPVRSMCATRNGLGCSSVYEFLLTLALTLKTVCGNSLYYVFARHFIFCKCFDKCLIKRPYCPGGMV
jgi:hypothetical protein